MADDINAVDKKRGRFLAIGIMGGVIILLFVAAFAIDRIFATPVVDAGKDGAPEIVGFVPVSIESQYIDILALGSSTIILFTDAVTSFNLTSLRLSGVINGTGRVEILLDNGIGQELLLFSNLKKKQGNLITGMAAGESEAAKSAFKKVGDENADAAADAWLKLSAPEKLNELPAFVVGDDETTFEGDFQNSCVDACFMNMKMKRNLFYQIKIRMDPGVQVRLTSLKYTLEV
jgi:hypothetical protein